MTLIFVGIVVTTGMAADVHADPLDDAADLIDCTLPPPLASDGPCAASAPAPEPRWDDQYGPNRIGADVAWQMTRGSTAAAVCVLDTGFQLTHEDAPKYWLGGWDFVSNHALTGDNHGHGTFVTGVAAATIDNGRGVAGIGNVGVYSGKVLNSQGLGDWDVIAKGIQWCADRPDPRIVINMSFGGRDRATAILEAAISYAAAKGRVLVAAVGNTPCPTTNDCIEYPARYGGVLSITCTDANSALCSFSATGPQADLTAPGANILSLWPTAWGGSNTSYGYDSGTSYAAPHVAGALALAWVYNPTWSKATLEDHARLGAFDLGTAGWDRRFGEGEVDVKCTLRLSPYPVRSVTATPGPGAGQVKVRWSAPERDCNGTVTNYRLYRKPEGGSTWSLIAYPGGDDYVDGGRGNGNRWYYYLRATSVYGTGDVPSNAAGATTFTVPSAPTSPNATYGGENEIDLSWSAPTDDGGTPVTGYKVYRKSSEGTFSLVATLGASARSYTDTGRTAGTTYEYRLSALNLVGEGQQTASFFGTAYAGPSAPTSPSAVPGGAVGEIDVSWSPPTSDGGSPLTAYTVYRASSPGGAEVEAAQVGPATTAWTDTGRVPGAASYYRISARNAPMGEGAKSAQVCSQPFPALSSAC